MTPQLGVLEWFAVGDEARVERALTTLKELGISHLRTGVSWADSQTDQGWAWIDWLLPRLAQNVEVLPCFLYTPPSKSSFGRTNAPPLDPKAFADFLDAVVARHGRHFEYVELWNEANNVSEWDYTLDPGWYRFAEMVGGAAHWARMLQKRTVLGGMSPVDPHWLWLMGERGVLDVIDVVGIHGFPGNYSASWPGWEENVRRVREVLDARNHPGPVWITETGHSTWNYDAAAQSRRLLEAMEARVERVYWYGLSDLSPDRAALEGFHTDERDYHFGLTTDAGEPKTLARLWQAGGLERVRELVVPSGVHSEGSEPVVLITGGAGFVGTNVTLRELHEGRRVRIFDNLSRPGVERNLRGVQRAHGDRLEWVVGDVRDRYAIREALRNVDRVYHFAAQVAVTTSVTDPESDFEVNARGTLNLLEEIRRLDRAPTMLFTSTNKVYGDLADLPMRKRGSRYQPVDLVVRSSGIGEDRPLSFHSPYGCSKGTADQYVLDYARTYGLPALVFRMSCIYGPHQYGTEDQGWVAHLAIRALRDEAVTIYGDGLQVRDVLFVEDLVDAMQLAQRQAARLAGTAFNVGGGVGSTLSLRELMEMLGERLGRPVRYGTSDWRTGDQRYYVSDLSLIERELGWRPKVAVPEGLDRLVDWLSRHVAAPALAPAVAGKETVDVRTITLR